jgi:hypothetical protein
MPPSIAARCANRCCQLPNVVVWEGVAERVSDVVKEILAVDKSDRAFDGRLDGHGKSKK